MNSRVDGFDEVEHAEIIADIEAEMDHDIVTSMDDEYTTASTCEVCQSPILRRFFCANPECGEEVSEDILCGYDYDTDGELFMATMNEYGEEVLRDVYQCGSCGHDQFDATEEERICDSCRIEETH